MDAMKILPVLMQGLTGTLNIVLNDDQLSLLIAELLQDKSSYFHSASSRDQYLELRLANNLFLKKANVTINYVQISKDSLRVGLSLLNVNRYILKGFLGILSGFGLDCEATNQDITLDLSKKWKNIVAKNAFDFDGKISVLAEDVMISAGRFEVTIRIN